MAIERTLSIIKPDAVAKNVIGQIYSRFEGAGLQIVAAKMKHRDIMGATNPKNAEAGTIRADFAASIDENACHGSDSTDSAAREIAYFFSAIEVAPRTR